MWCEFLFAREGLNEIAPAAPRGARWEEMCGMDLVDRSLYRSLGPAAHRAKKKIKSKAILDRQGTSIQCLAESHIHHTCTNQVGFMHYISRKYRTPEEHLISRSASPPSTCYQQLPLQGAERQGTTATSKHYSCSCRPPNITEHMISQSPWAEHYGAREFLTRTLRTITSAE